MEDLGEGISVVYGGLGLDALFVAGGIAGLLGGDALVGEGADISVVADAQDLALAAEAALGCVVEGVLLEGAGRIEVEAELGEPRLERAC